MNKKAEAIAYCSRQRQYSPEELLAFYLKVSPRAREALAKSLMISGKLKKYEAAALYSLMEPYNQKGNTILEIGTRLGYSASIIAQAAPLAKVVTMESSSVRSEKARKNLVSFPNVVVQDGVSWDVLAEYTGPLLAAIFVDADHIRASRDVPWFNWLKDGGLILFHDYVPVGSWPVVAAVQAMARKFGRRPAVEILDTNGVGMAGFYRQGLSEVYNVS